jgi:acyl-CoA thioesterase-1
MHKVYWFTFVLLLAAACSSPKPETPSTSSSPKEEPADVPPPPTPVQDDRPIILAFGDSLTEGSGLPPGSGYPEMLQKELDDAGYEYHVVNAGLGGDTTAGGLARLDSALAVHPDIVILELGANDGLRGLPVTSMQANLDEMIGAFKKADADVVLAGMTLPRNFGQDYISAFERVFPALAAKHRITLIPFFLEGAGGKPEMNLEDGIHPNEAGYRLVTANVLKYLEPLLKK